MNGPYTRQQNRSRKPFIELSLIALVLAAPSYTLYLVSQACDLLHNVAWVAFELARPIISAALQCVPAHFCGCSDLAQHLLQIVASSWTLLCS